MFVYHFVDPDLMVKMFFEKEGAAENGDVDFDFESFPVFLGEDW